MLKSPNLSLSDLLGEPYVRAVADARVFYGDLTREQADAIAREKVDFYPAERQRADDRLLALVGERVIEPFVNAENGAPTDAFARASHNAMSPVGGRGVTRVGEDGRLYFAAKSEHYHTPLGHAFPGYRLIDLARKLGIGNATHNNTRGYIVRSAERELIRAANGGVDDTRLDAILASREKGALNRVINLETGSLAVEAGVKMMLSRFWRLDKTYPAPKYAGYTPVFLVMADVKGGREANYHGTTVLTQMMRGMWPELAERVEGAGALRVAPVPMNDAEAFTRILRENNTGERKTAGFLHEIVMMNYGGIRLTPEFLQSAYRACRETDTPCLCDEIQSCMWYGGMFLFRKYGLSPDFAIVGKGFPGGEYPASKIITTAEMDTLNQFGALVTNGQEELAALAYRVTMRFALENAEEIDARGAYFHARLEDVAKAHPKLLSRAEGFGHLASLHFREVGAAAEFAKRMNAKCVDVSAQTYKADCPPAALVKPPLIASEKALAYLADEFAKTLCEMEEEGVC